MDVDLARLENWLPIAAIGLGGVLLLALVVLFVLKLLHIRQLFKQEPVFLELTPPASNDKKPLATQQLFSVFHGLEVARSWQDKLLRRKAVFSLELVSSRQQGIRYILRVPADDVSLFEQNITSYLPDVRFKRIEDYLSDAPLKKAKILSFKQTGHFAYPLRSQDFLGEHDPTAYLTGTMTKLAEEELMAFQVVVSPRRVREAERLANKLLSNEELLSEVGRRRIPGTGSIFSGLNSFLFSILDAVGDINSNGHSKPQQKNMQREQNVAAKVVPARMLSKLEQDFAESVHRKVNQPMFSADIRVLVAIDDKRRLKQKIKSVKASFAAFSVPKYQSLKARRNLPQTIKAKYRRLVFKWRLPAFLVRNSCLLSAAEVADLYHFPNSQAANVDNVVKSLSKTLPPPISLKANTDFDIILGSNHHHGTITPIGLTTKERERHIYIIGGTGHGKTTMMEYGIVQDIKDGKGVAIVDPHGDMAEKLLRYIPEERINDVVYFNPDDLAYPIGLNMLELPAGLEGDDLLRAKDLVAESVISVFRKIFSSDDSGGHRIEYVLRNTIQTALTVEEATLFTIYDLLNDPDYRKKVVSKLEDKALKNFWQHEISKAGGMQQVKMVAGITAKVGRFLFSASAKRILEQPKSTIDFSDILNGKILICNFSKGLLGEDTSELFGIAVLAKIQVAALQRARTKQADRKPFYLYVDEFQNFATMSFVQMLSEARKYKLFLTMAEQSTSQQDDQRMVNVILANVGTVVCFRTGNPMDERLLLPLFRPYIEEGEIANLPSFNFYMRISAIHAQEPFSGETIVLANNGNEETANRVIEASRKNHAIEYKPPEPNEEKKPTVKVERKTSAKVKPKKKPGIPKKDRLKGNY